MFRCGIHNQSLIHHGIVRIDNVLDQLGMRTTGERFQNLEVVAALIPYFLLAWGVNPRCTCKVSMGII